MNKKRNIIISGGLIILAIVYTILVKVIDVQAAGVNGTNIGFATFNQNFWNITGTNEGMDKFTDILLIVPILFVGLYALRGCVQLMKRKSLAKVDKEIIAVGIFYVILAILYVFFEKVIINYRPILIDGEMEASYPSSHTLMAICVCISAVMINNRLWKKENVKYINIGLIVVMLLTVIGRLISGVHWFTDIMGGVLISSALLMSFYTALESIPKKRIRK